MGCRVETLSDRPCRGRRRRFPCPMANSSVLFMARSLGIAPNCSKSIRLATSSPRAAWANTCLTNPGLPTYTAPITVRAYYTRSYPGRVVTRDGPPSPTVAAARARPVCNNTPGASMGATAKAPASVVLAPTQLLYRPPNATSGSNVSRLTRRLSQLSHYRIL